MCKKKPDIAVNNESAIPIFLNKPIDEESDDIIGFESSVNLLSQAIDDGAEMIAISSPFGSGKSSVVELLKEKRKGKAQNDNITKNGAKEKETIYTISMWSHLNASENTDPSILHRHLTYQLAERINPSIGTYINRRNSPNYKLISIFTNKKPAFGLTFLFLFALLACIFLWQLLKTLLNNAKVNSINQLCSVDINNWIFGVASILLITFILVFSFRYLLKTEIALSTHKSDQSRCVDEDEIIDVFQNEILINQFDRKRKTFIFVIEDLDRCDNKEIVLGFLKELRKYYIPDVEKSNKRNKIVFIVNINPDVLLVNLSVKQKNKDNSDTLQLVHTSDLYEKLFDYILDLQTIHTDDYKSVLNNLLEKHIEKLVNMNIVSQEYKKKPADTPGMEWIIWGEKIDIREIKHRLNRAIMIFISLKNRFPDKNDNISFKKCAVVAYLTTAFEADFENTEDRAFGTLVTERITEEITEENCGKIIQHNDSFSFSQTYIHEICELVNSKLIDDSYRMYFYNYPKGSRMNTYAESVVQDAILYGGSSVDISYYLEIVKQQNSPIIEDSFKRLLSLPKPLPFIIFDYEILYCESLRLYPEASVEAMKLLITNSTANTLMDKKIVRILHLDPDRNYYTRAIAERFCEVWDKELTENVVLSLRYSLCKEFPDEIEYYKILFEGSHLLIMKKESECIPFISAIRLLNYKHDNFTIKDVQEIVNRYNPDIDQSSDNEMQRLLEIVSVTMKPDDTVDVFLQYMNKRQLIIPALEKSIFDSFHGNFVNSARFNSYQQLINLFAVKHNLSKETMENIVASKVYEGFSSEVSNQLFKNQYYLESVIICLYNNDPIDFDNAIIRKTIQEGVLTSIPSDIFLKLRLRIVMSVDDLTNYSFMFNEKHPIMTREEVMAPENKDRPLLLLDLWPVSMVSDDSAKYFVEYWNRKFRSNNIAYEILKYISRLSSPLVQICFDRIDFHSKIKYFSFRSDKKKEIIKCFSEILSLNSVSGMLRFIQTTQCMNETWLSQNQLKIIGDEIMEKAFADALNQSDPSTIGSVSINTIGKMKCHHSFTEFIENELLSSGLYLNYAASTILRQKKLVYDPASVNSDLEQVYTNLYLSETGPIFDYICENVPFIQRMMYANVFSNLDEKHRLPFAFAKQTAACIDELINGSYVQSFMQNYVLTMEKFDDVDAEIRFVNLTKENPWLLQNSIYNHIYSRLSPPQKALYTRYKNRLSK